MNRRTLGMLFAGALAFGATSAFAQQKPAELKIGITTFTSGPASVFGVPAKAAAELLIEEMNAAGRHRRRQARAGRSSTKASAATSCCPSTGASCRSRASGDAVARSPAATATSSRRSPRT